MINPNPYHHVFHENQAGYKGVGTGRRLWEQGAKTRVDTGGPTEARKCPIQVNGKRNPNPAETAEKEVEDIWRETKGMKGFV
jgi:exonuclease III